MRQFSNTRVTTILGTLLFLAGVFTSGVQAQERTRNVTVSGEGKIEVAPDMAMLRFGIETLGETPDEVRDANGSASRDAMNVVRALGVDEKDMELTSLRLEPWQEYDSDRRTYVRKGWKATRSVSVTVRDLDDLPELVASVVQNGANRIDGIQYMLENREGTEHEALRRAVRNAKEKAIIMADELETHVGPVLEISQHGISVPQPIMRMESAMVADKTAGDPEAFASGRIEVTASVTISFYLVD